MKTLSTICIVIFAIISAIVVYFGLDLKKWHSWLFGLYGFLTFFLIGIFRTSNFQQAIIIGLVVASATMFVGVTTRWNRERAKKWLRNHYGEEE